MVNISRAWRVFKVPLILLASAVTLKGINTRRGQSQDKRKSRYDLTSPGGKAILTSVLIHIMLADSLVVSVVIEKMVLYFPKHS